MLARCSPSSKWVPGGNTGEIQAARKETGHPISHADHACDHACVIWDLNPRIEAPKGSEFPCSLEKFPKSPFSQDCFFKRSLKRNAELPPESILIPSSLKKFTLVLMFPLLKEASSIVPHNL